MLRLVTALPRLQLLVGALLKSLGAMGYVGLLLALMFYIFSQAEDAFRISKKGYMNLGITWQSGGIEFSRLT